MATLSEIQAQLGNAKTAVNFAKIPSIYGAVTGSVSGVLPGLPTTGVGQILSALPGPIKTIVALVTTAQLLYGAIILAHNALVVFGETIEDIWGVSLHKIAAKTAKGIGIDFDNTPGFLGDITKLMAEIKVLKAAAKAEIKSIDAEIGKSISEYRAIFGKISRTITAIQVLIAALIPVFILLNRVLDLIDEAFSAAQSPTSGNPGGSNGASGGSGSGGGPKAPVGKLYDGPNKGKVITAPSGPGGGFLWKPVSDSTGGLVVLLPSTGDDGFAKITDTDGNTIATGSFSGRSNGNRPTYRFSKPGAQYNEVFIEIPGFKGFVECGKLRYEPNPGPADCSASTVTDGADGARFGESPLNDGQVRILGDEGRGNTSVGSSVGAPSGFLWKPRSDGDGRLVVLLPTNVSNGDTFLEFPDGTTEGGKFTGRSNGNRETYRFSKSGGSYPNGTKVHFAGTTLTIPDGAKRYER